MSGIKAYGAYIPFYRLDKKVIGTKGEKAICCFDEDSLTMGVEAVNDCLRNRDRSPIDALYFGTTTSLYKEHSGSTTMAIATDLRDDVYTAEFGNTLRSGTAAMKAGFESVAAGSANSVIVCASDARLGAPGSLSEKNFGDGAAALLIDSTSTAVTLEGSRHVTNEVYDVWRNNNQPFVRQWENRFALEQGYLSSMKKAISRLMDSLSLQPSDFSKVVLYSPDARRSAQLAKGLGFDPKSQLQDPLVDLIGDTGSASALLLLVASLEKAQPGDRILLASYGNGADAFSFRINEEIVSLQSNQKGLGVKGHLESKKTITDYLKYLQWKDLLPTEKITGPHAAYSAVAAKREVNSHISIHGSKCKECGAVQFPAQRVCTKCRLKDVMEPFSFLGQKGSIFTFNLDYITPRAEMPVVTTEVDFDCGGRIQCYMTEVDVEELRVNQPVEMAFRRNVLWEDISLREGIYSYFWESKPLR